MLLKRIALFAALFLVTFQLACHDYGVEPPHDPELFDIEYWFVNQGDSTIKAVEILSTTYYPKENITRARMHNYQRPGEFDTVRDTAVAKGYIGCIVNIGIYINKAWEQDRVPCWRFFFFPQTDTIHAYADRIQTFRWPQDTSIAVQQYLDQMGFCKP